MRKPRIEYNYGVPVPHELPARRVELSENVHCIPRYCEHCGGKRTAVPGGLSGETRAKEGFYWMCLNCGD